MEYLALYDVYIFVITPESSSYQIINYTWNIFDSTTFSVVSQNSVLEEDSTEDDWEFGSQQSESFTSLAHDQGSQHVKRDLIMVISFFFSLILIFLIFIVGCCFPLCQVHLLHLACTKGPLADSLPQITAELQNIGVCSFNVSA